jgi:NAD(P)-dependent dehydrogenase (short-subunit alcohol dehydrogenase family)/acyl carrier protein
VTSDLVLFSEDGQVLSTLDGFTCRSAPRDTLLRQEEAAVGNWLYVPSWHRSEQPVAPRPPAADAFWLVFSPHATPADGLTLVERMRRHGARAICVRTGPAYERISADEYRLDPDDRAGYARLIKEVFAENASCQGIVHAWSLDATPIEQTTTQSLEADQHPGCLSALYLVQALARTGVQPLPHLWLLTSGAQAVEEDRGGVAVGQAPLWGLGKVLALEHPDLGCTCIDTSPTSDASEQEALLRELWSCRSEDQIVLRGAHRYVARLLHGARVPTVRTEDPVIRPDGSYLITGGLGGLGLLAAELLVARGARHLVLIGRSPASAAAEQAIVNLEDAGAQIITAQVDVTHDAALAQLVAHFGPQWPPLRGVLHTAGALADSIVLQQNAALFQRAMAPKMRGAWNLHVLTAAQPLDFFVCYSSGTSLLGNTGQASYAAANAFLDALAHHRRQRGLCAMTINWGAFSEVGMAASIKGLAQRLAERGMQSMTPEEGQRALWHLLRRPRTQVGVMKLDIQKLAQHYPSLSSSAHISELLKGHPTTLRSEPAALAPLWERLRAASAEERQALLEQRLRHRVGHVLHIAVTAVDAQQLLPRLGLDSLMAAELSNQLDADFRVLVPVTFLLEEASIASLVAYLLERLIDEPTEQAEREAIEEGVV